MVLKWTTRKNTASKGQANNTGKEGESNAKKGGGGVPGKKRVGPALKSGKQTNERRENSIKTCT